jgi:effector-binding domain-containing protein
MSTTARIAIAAQAAARHVATDDVVRTDRRTHPELFAHARRSVCTSAERYPRRRQAPQTAAPSGATMSYQCELIEMSSQHAVAVRSMTTYHKLPKTIGDGFASLKRYLRDQHITPTGPMYVKYAGNPAHDFTIEVGVPVTAQSPILAGFEPVTMPSGRAASCVHRGHYTDLPHAYKALEAWLATQGLATTGEAYELYLNDGEHTPPDAWLTRVAMPLA